MRMTSELMQFEMGTSTRRYLPPSGTAGFDRSRVSGKSRLPAPPPRITANRLRLEAIRDREEDIGKEGGDSRNKEYLWALSNGGSILHNARQNCYAIFYNTTYAHQLDFIRAR